MTQRISAFIFPIRHIISLSVLCILLLSGCKKGPSVSTGELRGLQVNDLQYENFSGKAKLHFDDGKTKLGATAGIRMLRDSIIWISVSPGLGIEAARGLFTADSVFFINKINREYYAYAYSDLQQIYGIEFRLRSLQDILLGNLAEMPTVKDDARKGDKTVILKQNRSPLLFETHLDIQKAKPIQLTINEKSSGSKLVALYSDFEALNGTLFPRKNELNVVYPAKDELVKALLSIEFSKMEVNVGDLSFPFSIPEKYERKN